MSLCSLCFGNWLAFYGCEVDCKDRTNKSQAIKYFLNVSLKRILNADHNWTLPWNSYVFVCIELYIWIVPQYCTPLHACTRSYRPFKDAMPVSFGQNCLHLTIYPTLNSETYPCKYESAKCSYSCMLKCNEKMNLLKMCGPQVWFCLLTFRHIALRQMHSLIITNSFIGPVVTHQPWLFEVPCSIAGSGKVFMFYFVCYACRGFTFFPNTLFGTKLFNFFCHINALQCLWPIQRWSR